MYNKATPKLQNEPKIEFLYTYVLTFLHAYDLQNKPKILRFQPKNKSCSKNKANFNVSQASRLVIKITKQTQIENRQSLRDCKSGQRLYNYQSIKV